MLTKFLFYLVIIFFSKNVCAEVFILKDGRIFEANNYNEKNGIYYIEMKYGLLQINMDNIEKIVGHPGLNDDTGISSKKKIEYHSNNSVLILKNGSIVKTKKTYEENEFIVCETVSEKKYYTKNDIEDIVIAKNIINDEKDLKNIEKNKNIPKNKSNNTLKSNQKESLEPPPPPSTGKTINEASKNGNNNINSNYYKSNPGQVSIPKKAGAIDPVPERQIFKGMRYHNVHVPRN